MATMFDVSLHGNDKSIETDPLSLPVPIQIEEVETSSVMDVDDNTIVVDNEDFDAMLTS